MFGMFLIIFFINNFLLFSFLFLMPKYCIIKLQYFDIIVCLTYFLC